MAQKFLTNIDLNRNALVNGTFEVVGSDPGSGFEGQLIYNSTEGVIKVRVGSEWRRMIYSAVSGGSNSSALTVTNDGGAYTFTPNLATSASAGVMSAADYSKLASATHESVSPWGTLVKRDGDGRFRAEAPSDDKDVANKAYVDAARSGLDVKDSVRAATTAPITVASTSSGSVVDGVTLATGDRLLVKNQSTGSENGIYVVQATGALVRATDFDSTAEVTPGAFTFVEEGTVNADSGWVVTTNGTITVGTTALSFAQFSGAGSITAGDGLTKTGNELDVNTDATTTYINGSNQVAVKSSGTAGQTLLSQGSGSAAWGALNIASSSAVTGTLPIANGGTNSTSAVDARTNLAAGTTGGTTGSPVLARIISAGCLASSGSTSVTTVTHNFGTKNVIVQIYEVSSGETIIGTVTRGTTSSVSVTLNGSNIQANDYTILVSG